jgi:hypothetical protein
MCLITEVYVAIVSLQNDVGQAARNELRPLPALRRAASEVRRRPSLRVHDMPPAKLPLRAVGVACTRNRMTQPPWLQALPPLSSSLGANPQSQGLKGEVNDHQTHASHQIRGLSRQVNDLQALNVSILEILKR